MIFRCIDWLRRQAKDTRGRASFTILFLGILFAIGIIAVNFWATDSLHHARFTFAQSTATTTVTVLNTPPNWTVDAQEASPGSSTSTPTNVDASTSWNGTATDPNNDSFYLLICKTSSTPSGGAGGAAPTCGGGAGNQWAVSAVAASGNNATATYTPTSTDPQINPWFAWICDNNAGGAQCNGTFKQGTGSTASPFVVNHRPNFSSLTTNGPKDPGASITWTANASDTDNFTGATDTVQLFVCRANDFSGSACGPGGSYCTSTVVTASPSCSYTIPIPRPDKAYNSYGYVIDQHTLAASGGAENATTSWSVNNVAPTLTSSSINILNTDGSSTPLALTTPAGQTNGFAVAFTASDNNSCQNGAGGNEIASATINVFRSGIGSSSCLTAGNYNSNNCYPAAVGSTTWNISCTQDGGSCNGSSSLTATWTCFFPLWYNADPTDGTQASDTQFFNQNWLATVKITDDNGSSSPLVQGATGNEVASFLATQLNTPSINFGSLSPGSQNSTLATSTVLAATGNVGLNETLYGLDMCPNFPTCPVSTTSTIPVGQIQYATSSVNYGSGIALLVNPGALFRVQIPKSTTTTTQSTGSTFWGIAIPSTIQLSGAYTGQNTFVGVKSPAQTW